MLQTPRRSLPASTIAFVHSASEAGLDRNWAPERGVPLTRSQTG